MITVIKTIITTVLLSTLLVTASDVEARLKYYRYNANIPMVEMSLNMMVAMGVLEQIPGQLVHDGNPYHRLVAAKYSPYSRSAYRYPGSSRYYNNYRYNNYLDGPVSPYSSYYDSPYSSQYDSPYSSQYDSPYSSQYDSPYGSYYRNRYGHAPGYPRDRTWGSRWDSPWGNRWGNQWNDPWSNTWGSPWDYQRGNPWNSTLDSPWGNQWINPWNSNWSNPWGGAWSNQWMNPWSSQPGYPGAWPYTPGYSSLPLSPDAILGDDWSKNNPYQSDDSSRQNHNKDGYKAEKTSWSGRPSSMSYRRSGYRNGNNRPYRKLNGLWIGENGEMLGIRGNRFLWYDDDNQYAKGQLLKSPTMMKARIEGANTVVSYHYKLHGNELVIMRRDGKMHTFNRMPLRQPRSASVRPHASYSSYNPESDTSYVSRSRYGPDVASPEALYPRGPSETVASAPEHNKHTDAAAPYTYSSYASSSTKNLHVPYALKALPDDVAAASNSTASGNTRGMIVPKTTHDTNAAAMDAKYSTQMINKQWPVTSYSNDSFSQTESLTPDTSKGDDIWKPLTPYSTSNAYPAAQAATSPVYMRYAPAAGASFPGGGADSVASSAANVDAAKNTKRSSLSGLDMNDPYTYLYSYLKDNGNIYASNFRNNSRQKDSTSTYANNSYTSASSAAAVKNDSSNIWKPNNSHAQGSRYHGDTQSGNSNRNTARAGSEKVANSEVRKFVWSEPSPWH